MKCDNCDNEATVFLTQVAHGGQQEAKFCDSCSRRAAQSPSYLPVRLKRETPFTSQLGCTAMLAVVLLGFGYFCFLAGGNPHEKNSWVAKVVGGGFGFFGVLLAFSFIRQLGAIGLKETIVELSDEPLQPGKPARICVIQPGPAKLKSLRVNILSFEQRRFTVRDSESGRDEGRIAEKLLDTTNLVDARHINVSHGDAWHEIHEFTLPADAREAGTRGNITTTWRIEVWCTGYFLASLMHPFLVDVHHGPRPEEKEDEEVGEGSIEDGE
jgi:hypothetical protein